MPETRNDQALVVGILSVCVLAIVAVIFHNTHPRMRVPDDLPMVEASDRNNPLTGCCYMLESSTPFRIYQDGEIDSTSMGSTASAFILEGDRVYQVEFDGHIIGILQTESSGPPQFIPKAKKPSSNRDGADPFGIVYVDDALFSGTIYITAAGLWRFDAKGIPYHSQFRGADITHRLSPGIYLVVNKRYETLRLITVDEHGEISLGTASLPLRE